MELVTGITSLDAPAIERRLDDLCDLLMDAVNGGASVSFLAPLSREHAAAYWRSIIADVARGERLVLLDMLDGRVVGSVQCVFSPWPNQPHRADIGKMLVHSSQRRKGRGRALLAAVEAASVSAGRTLLVLDTVPNSPAEALYQSAGWSRCGEIPGFALLPTGDQRLAPTVIYYKRLG